MDIFKEKFTFTKQARLHLDSSAREIFDDLVKDWDLFEWEDALVFQLYPWREDNVLSEDDLTDADALVATLRGQDGTVPFSADELDGIDWPHSLAEDLELPKRLLRTLYFCLNQEDRILAMAVRIALDPLIVNKNEVIPTQVKEQVVQPYMVLCAYFFFLLPDKLSYYLFESGFILIGFKSGFDWEAIVRSATDKMISFNHRQSLCIELAASLSENLTPLGADINGEVKNIKYWLDNFRIFSKDQFGGQELFAFLNDSNYVGGCTGEDKELIRQIMELYTHLINGYLAVPGGDLAAVENRMKVLEKTGKTKDAFAYFDDKPQEKLLISEEDIVTQPPKTVVQKSNFTISNADIRKIIISEFGYMSDGQYENLDEVLARLAEFAVEFNRPEIADLYYFDEKQNKFVWKE